MSPVPIWIALWFAAACLWFGSTSPVLASRAAISEICDSAAVVASRESGVPLDVLRAISLTETGRKSDGRLAPWPWTVNMEGIGKWFDDVGTAQAYVDRHFARGARSFDVGCFQINYKWHGRAFTSIEEMFDPISNARYAARFLAELHAEFGDWSRAAGAYHSRTPKYAKRYTARFDRIRAGLSEHVRPAPIAAAPSVAEATETPTVRRNDYPFLTVSQQARGPSLVPLAGTGTAFFGNRRTTPLLGSR